MGRVNIPLQSIAGPSTAGGALRRPILEDPSIAAAPGAALAQGAGEIAGVLAKLEKARKDAADASILARRVAAAQRSYVRFFVARSQDSAKHESLVQDLESFSGELLKSATQGVTDPTLAGAITTRLNDYLQGKLGEAEFVARKQAIDAHRGRMDATLIDLQAVAAASTSDQERQQHIQAGLQLIGLMRQTGVLTSEQAVAQAVEFGSKAEEVVVRRQLLDNPVETYQDLLDESQFPNLSPQSRTTLLGIAQRQAEAQQRRDLALLDRAERRADKAMKEAQERNEASFRSQVRATPDFLLSGEAARELERMREHRLIDPTRYDELRAWVDAAELEGGFDDAPTVTEIQIGVYSGRLQGQAALRAILNARLKGRVTNSTAASLEDLVQETPPQLNTEEARRASEYVNTQLGVIRGIIGAGLDSSLIARANREFYFRVRDGGQPWEVAEDLVSRFSQNLDNLQVERPRFATPEEALSAFERGELSAKELELEAQLHRVLSLKRERAVSSAVQGGSRDEASAAARRKLRDRGRGDGEGSE